MPTENPYQYRGCPLIQHFWPYAGGQKWIAWNWITACWDTLDKPQEKK